MTPTLSFGRFELLPASRQLLLDGQAVAIGARAFDVLHALIERRERLVTKEELLDVAWPGLVVEENNLQVQVSSLRKILGPDAIITIPGLGYRFTVPLRAAGSQSYLKPAKDLAPIDDEAPSIAVLPFTDLSLGNGRSRGHHRQSRKPRKDIDQPRIEGPRLRDVA